MPIAIAGATGMVGRAVAEKLRARDVSVVSLSREEGVDLTIGQGLDRLLPRVTGLIDVCNSPSRDEREATAFFTSAATHLGSAAIQHGVQRLVVLSIIGVDRSGHGYYAAKLAQEKAHREAFDEVSILRSAQFHEFAAQMLGWGRDGNRCLVPDMPVQPVSLATVATRLVDLATIGDAVRTSSIAGPRVERLVDMVAQLARHDGLEIEVVPQTVDDAIRDGALLADATATLAGPTFGEWLEATR